MSRTMGPPVRPAYEEMEDYRRQDLEYDLKISALKHQIQELRTLLARPGQHPHPGTEEVKGPTSPSTPEHAETMRA